MPEDERYEGDDLEVLARAEEAEEAAFGEEEVGVCCSVRSATAAPATFRRQQLAPWQPAGRNIAALFRALQDTPLTVAACFAVLCCVSVLHVQDGGEPLNIVDEVIRSRKRKKKASDEQIDHDVYNLVAQVSGTQRDGPALARAAGCSVHGLAGVTRVGPARPAVCRTQHSSPQHRVAPPQCCCALRPSCVRHTKQCAVVAVACCLLLFAPQMKACADKDLRVVTEGQKKPAMAKFQHLQHVSRGRGCSVKQR